MLTNNTPITDAELAELRRLHAAAPRGTWQIGKNKASGRVQIHNGQHQVCAVWHTAAHPAMETAEAIAALHNASPGLLALIEDLQAYRDEVEAAKPTVQALLDSGERAAGEVADLRQRLESAERERDELQMRLNGRNATGGRDALLKRLGVAEWLESEVERAKQSSRVWITYERDYFEQAAQRLREGGE